MNLAPGNFCIQGSFIFMETQKRIRRHCLHYTRCALELFYEYLPLGGHLHWHIEEPPLVRRWTQCLAERSPWCGGEMPRRRGQEKKLVLGWPAPKFMAIDDAECGKLDGFPWISHLANRFALLLARMKHESNCGMHRAPDLMCGT